MVSHEVTGNGNRLVKAVEIAVIRNSGVLVEAALEDVKILKPKIILINVRERERLVVKVFDSNREDLG